MPEPELIKKEEPQKVVEKVVEKPLEIDGKPVTAEDYKALQGKVAELGKIATAHDSTKKERDDALKELTEMKTRQEALEQMISGRKPDGSISLDNMPEPAILNEKTGEWEFNPAYQEYQKLTGTTLIELRDEIKKLKQVAGATGVQNVNNSNAILRREFKDAHSLDDGELNEIIELGIKEKIIPSYPVGDKSEAIIGNAEQLEKARDSKFQSELRVASKKGDMKTVQELTMKYYSPKQATDSLRLRGGGGPDKSDAEKKFQAMAVGKIEIGDLMESEIDELISKGLMSNKSKIYRWAPAQKKT